MSITYENFVGFTFNNKHSSEFGILHVSPYEEPFYGNITDNYKEVTGKVGAYYTNTIIGVKTFSINLVVYEMTAKQLMMAKQWLYPNTTGTLIFDETPYLQRTVKVSANPLLSFTPLSARDGTYNHTYNGTVSIQFTMFDPFDYAVEQSVLSYESKGDYKDIWRDNSNILLTSQMPLVSTTGVLTTAFDMYLMNSGTYPVKPDISVVGSATNLAILCEVEEDTFEGIVIDSMSNEELLIENEKGQISLVFSTTDVLCTYRRSDTSVWLELEPTVYVSRYDSAIYTEDIGNYILTLPSDDVWDAYCEGKFCCINNNWYKISDRVSDTVIYLEDNDSLVADTEYDDLVIGVLNHVKIMGDTLDLTSVTFSFSHKYI